MNAPKALARTSEAQRSAFSPWQRFCLRLAGLRPAEVEDWRTGAVHATRTLGLATELQGRLALAGGCGDLPSDLLEKMQERATAGDYFGAGEIYGEHYVTKQKEMN